MIGGMLTGGLQSWNKQVPIPHKTHTEDYPNFDLSLLGCCQHGNQAWPWNRYRNRHMGICGLGLAHCLGLGAGVAVVLFHSVTGESCLNCH